MRITLLVGGLLIIIFGEYAESRSFLNWEDKLEADVERIEQEAEAREEQMEAEEEAREKQMEAEEEAREKQFQADLNEMRQKCAKTGFSNDADGYSNRMITFTNSIDGFRHIYVQTYNPTTKKVSGSYYRINENDPKAEPICGKLDIESTS